MPNVEILSETVGTQQLYVVVTPLPASPDSLCQALSTLPTGVELHSTETDGGLLFMTWIGPAVSPQDAKKRDRNVPAPVQWRSPPREPQKPSPSPVIPELASFVPHPWLSVHALPGLTRYRQPKPTARKRG